jgi:amidase
VEWTAVEIATAVRSDALTAREAVEESLARIKAVDGRLGAYQIVRADAALREAVGVDARPDKHALPLAGVPIAVKDNVEVTGEPMRVGSIATDPTPRSHDHAVVQRLRAAGAVIVGITRVPELCVFGATDSAFGVTRNPWDLARTTGGSSGGSAAAVASGTVPVAHGNDGMGSVRIPSSCCGLVGIKPGFGVVPAELGNGSWFGMAENGALGTTVADVALMLSVLAEQPAFATVSEPGTLRVAVSTRVPLSGGTLDKHWAAAARSTGELLRDAGHSVLEKHPPYGQTTGMRAIARWTAGTELDAQLLIKDRSALEKRIRRHSAVGRMLLRVGLPKEAGRATWRARAEKFFADVDVLLTPGLAHPPISASTWGKRGWLANVAANAYYTPFAMPWNLAGWPAIVVPTGIDPRGLPLTVQLVGKPGTEGRLLALAGQLEHLRPWQKVAESLA